MNHNYSHNMMSYTRIYIILFAAAMYVISGCTIGTPVVPTSTSIPLSITPNVNELVNGQTVIISVASEIWRATDLDWQITSDELESFGELSSNVEPSIVYSAPESGHGAVKITVIGYTKEFTGTADVIFDILPAGPYVTTASNLRSGPGIDYDVVSTAKPFQQLNIVAKNSAGDWFKLDTDTWIAAFLVNNPPKDLPVAEFMDNDSDILTATPSDRVGIVCVDGFVSASLDIAACSDHRGIGTWIESSEDSVQVQEEGSGGFPGWYNHSTQYCNGLEWNVTDVRRGKSVYWQRTGFEAAGEWVAVYIHTRNVSPQTISPKELMPRLNGYMFHLEGTYGAAYMATGGYNHPWMKINPGQEIGFVVAWDVQTGLGTMNLEMKACNQVLSLGDLFGIQRGIIKPAQ